MFFKDHSPPHFHAEYGEHKAVIKISNQEVMEGNIPEKQIKLV